MHKGFTRRGVYLASSLLLILAMVLSACAPGGAPAASEPAAPAADAGEVYQIAFSVPAMSFPFFVHMEKQVRDEAAKLGNVEIITLDGQDNTTKQVADLEGVIAQGYDGLIVSPRTNEGVAPVIQQVIDAGIPVVTIDRRADGVTGLLAHVGADNVIGGEAQGEAILSLFPDGAKIIELLGTPGASPAIDRSAGLHNIIDPAGNIEVVCQQTGNFNRNDGLTVTENCLTANPDVQAIVAANDDMALGAIEAASAAGLAAFPSSASTPCRKRSRPSTKARSTVRWNSSPAASRAPRCTRSWASSRRCARRRAMSSCCRRSWSAKENIMEAERIGEVPGMEGMAPRQPLPPQPSN
jgi:ABC-type sugar transport system substrate-binding protein